MMERQKPKFGENLIPTLLLFLPSALGIYLVLIFAFENLFPKLSMQFNPFIFVLTVLIYFILVSIDLIKDYLKALEKYYDAKFDTFK